MIYWDPDGSDKVASLEGFFVRMGRVKNITNFMQGDSPWGSKPYNPPGQTGRTICSSGCGPTTVATAYSTLTGNKTTPDVFANWAVANGFRDPGGTNPRFLAAVAEAKGLPVLTISPKALGREAALDELFNILIDGQHMAGVNVKPGVFTTGGHYIGLAGAGIDHDGNKWFLVTDPNARMNSKRPGGFHPNPGVLEDESRIGKPDTGRDKKNWGDGRIWVRKDLLQNEIRNNNIAVYGALETLDPSQFGPGSEYVSPPETQ